MIISDHNFILIFYSQGPTYNLQNVDVTADTTNKIDMAVCQNLVPL